MGPSLQAVHGNVFLICGRVVSHLVLYTHLACVPLVDPMIADESTCEE